MSSIQAIFSSLIRWGLILGTVGALPYAIRYLANEAFHSHQVGLISLGKLNRQLIRGGAPKASAHPVRHMKVDRRPMPAAH